MSNTATATATAAADPRITGLNPDLTILFARTESEITLRLDAWAETGFECWAIIPTVSGASAEIYGKLYRAETGGYRLMDRDYQSSVSLPLTAIESVGSVSIFLKSR
jgi:hypothetical protein